MQQVIITLISFNPLKLTSKAVHCVKGAFTARGERLQNRQTPQCTQVGPETTEPKQGPKNKTNNQTIETKIKSQLLLFCTGNSTVVILRCQAHKLCSLKREESNRTHTPPTHPHWLLIINHYHKALWTIWHTEDKSENMSDEPAEPHWYICRWMSSSCLFPCTGHALVWWPIKFTSMGLWELRNLWPMWPERRSKALFLGVFVLVFWFSILRHVVL